MWRVGWRTPLSLGTAPTCMGQTLGLLAGDCEVHRALKNTRIYTTTTAKLLTGAAAIRLQKVVEWPTTRTA